MIEHTEPQGTPEWHEARLGLLTASVCGKLVTPTGRPANNEARRTLMYGLLGEIYTGWPDQDIGHLPAIARGHELEPRGRDYYAAMYDVEIREVGLVTDDERTIGASLDGIIVEGGEDVGSWEMKAPGAKTHLYYLDGGVDVPRYRAQLQVQLRVSGLPWCEFLSYHPDLPEMRVRVWPDAAWAGVLDDVLSKWNEDMANARARLEAKGCKARGLHPEWVANWHAEQALRDGGWQGAA